MDTKEIHEEKCDDCGRVVETHDDKGNGTIKCCYAEYFEKDSIWMGFDSKNAKLRLCAKCEEPRRKELDEKYDAVYIGGRGCGR